MFKSAMNLFVILVMLQLILTHSSHMFLEVSLTKKDAGAVGAFEVTVVTGLLLSHSFGLFDVYEDFFAVEFGFVPVCL
jgi:hypothetical protein